MNQVQETLETTAVAMANKATFAGSAVSVLGGLTESQIGLWAGILIGFAGLAVNWYFKRKADKRNEASHAAFLANMSLGRAMPNPDVIEDKEEA